MIGTTPPPLTEQDPPRVTPRRSIWAQEPYKTICAALYALTALANGLSGHPVRAAVWATGAAVWLAGVLLSRRRSRR